jgi:hypothetical protein
MSIKLSERIEIKRTYIIIKLIVESFNTITYLTEYGGLNYGKKKFNS